MVLRYLGWLDGVVFLAHYHSHFESVQNVEPEKLRINELTPKLHISSIQVGIQPVLIPLSVGMYVVSYRSIPVAIILQTISRDCRDTHAFPQPKIALLLLLERI